MFNIWIEFIPIHKDSHTTETILNAAIFYAQDLLSSSDLVLKAEINLWKSRWNKIETNIPHTVVTIFSQNPKSFYNYLLRFQYPQQLLKDHFLP